MSIFKLLPAGTSSERGLGMKTYEVFYQVNLAGALP
jgi:hypothetical protein